MTNDKMMWIENVMVEFEAFEEVRGRIYTRENENGAQFFICWRHGVGAGGDAKGCLLYTSDAADDYLTV